MRHKRRVSQTAPPPREVHQVTQQNYSSKRSMILVNILFMAPRMVYCSMELIWSKRV